MSRWIAVIIVAVMLLVGGGMLVTFIQRMRYDANVAASRNNLRQLALFAAHHADPAAVRAGANLPNAVPPATVVLPGVPPAERLSWVVAVLPGLDRANNPTAVLAGIDLKEPWTAERNQRAARIRLSTLLCPENTPEPPPNAPAITCYVGIAGDGLDAATLTLPPTGPPPPRAGAFRYDAPTPFDRILDGLSQVLLMGESANEPGPWLRGGPSTTRGVDDSPGAKPFIGVGGQFGGFFLTGANFAFCDGSVRQLTPQVSPQVFLKLATIAGGDQGPVPE